MTQARRAGGTARFVRDMLIILLAAILVSFLVKTFLFRSFYIPSGSMQNTLLINDRVIVDELVPKTIPLKHGDVIVFRDPGGWLQPGEVTSTTSSNPVVAGVQKALTVIGLGTADSDDHLIKRVIGLPGDKVACCTASGQTMLNGVALTEPYKAPSTEAQNGNPKTFSVTVPKGEVWVEGDNRFDSEDSRYHQDLPTKGFVPESDIVGRAFVISWPSSRWATLPDFPDVFRSAVTAQK